MKGKMGREKGKWMFEPQLRNYAYAVVVMVSTVCQYYFDDGVSLRQMQMLVCLADAWLL